LTSPYTLGGVVALSAWLPLSQTFPQVCSQFVYLEKFKLYFPGISFRW